MKKYKTQSPANTIDNIRMALKSLDILLFEKHVFQEEYCSCRVAIGNNGLSRLNIGTNGKGRSFEYSLASGYAEFMERLQNGLLLSSKKIFSDKLFSKLSFMESQNESNNNFVYAYDERTIDISDLDNTVKDAIRKMCGATSLEDVKDIIGGNRNEIITVPYYSVKEQKKHYFPIEFLLTMTGSNGMAAGNSSKEAILQGICEIFERYVIEQIYWKQITPPTIPLEFFKGTAVYENIISYLQKRELTLIVKDCSLGCGIPALGLLIIDKKNQLYNFKIGVDCVPEIALERCLTEVHQGSIKFHGLPFEFVDTKYTDQGKKKTLEANLLNTFINGTGFWPISILGDTPTYNFKGFPKNLGNTNTTDLRYCIKIIEQLGYDIYIRDNSILGFPTYHIVVPGMSQILKRKPSEQDSYTESFNKIIHLNHLGHIDSEMARELFEAMHENYELMTLQRLELKKVFVFNCNQDLNSISLELFLSMLAYYIGEDQHSYSYLTKYLQGKDKNAYRYFYACADFLKLKSEKHVTPINILSQLYGRDLAEEVFSDFADPSKIFQYYKFPSCPDCSSCKLQEECRVHEINAINKRIKDISAENKIKQEDIRIALEDNNE